MWLPGLMLRIRQSSIAGSHVAAWIKSFVTNRSMSIRVNGFTDTPFSLHKGLPQGSPLSSILYIHFTAPLLEMIGPSAIAYADDVTLVTHAHAKSSVPTGRNLGPMLASEV